MAKPALTVGRSRSQDGLWMSGTLWGMLHWVLRREAKVVVFLRKEVSNSESGENEDLKPDLQGPRW